VVNGRRRETLAELIAERDQLRLELMVTKQQLEYVLASIRRTYDLIRAEQGRLSAEKNIFDDPAPRQPGTS